MEVYKDVKKEFLPKYERHEPVVLDHTAIITYKTCPRKYFYRMVLGFTERETQPYFVSGSAYHTYRKIFDLTWKAEENLPFQDRFDYSHILGVDAAVKKWMDKTKGKEVPAPNTKWDWITLSRLKLSLAKTKDWLQVEKKTGNIIVLMTEQPFIVEVEKDIFYGGTADQVVKWNNRLWGRDFKTSSKEKQYFKRTLKPNNQFLGYTISEELLHGSTVDGQLVEVLFNSKSKPPEITPYPNSFNVYEKGVWRKQLVSWTEKIRISREKDMYEMAEVHCPFCPFHMVCAAGNENQIMALLESKYKVEPWDHQNIDNELEAG